MKLGQYRGSGGVWPGVHTDDGVVVNLVEAGASAGVSMPETTVERLEEDDEVTVGVEEPGERTNGCSYR